MSKVIIQAASAAFFLLFLLHTPLSGQEDSGGSSPGFAELVEWAYGQDQELVNGLQYYNRHPRSLGHPYLMEGLVHQGSVNIRGKLYEELWLKFNIHTQQVEVEYQTVNGAYNQVVLVNDRVRSFSIGNNYFERIELMEGPEKFYQVLGNGRIIWYIYWYKNLVPVSGDSRYLEEFTPVKRENFLALDGTLYPFSSKKSFVKLFPETIQKDVKKLIKSSGIQIRSASPQQLELFIIAAGNLLNGGGQ